jgi:hypothetical protein
MKKKDKILENIKYFCAYHSNQVKVISKLEVEDFGRDYKKLLYSSQIDALSRTVYPHRNSKYRFVEFIKIFSDWSEGNKISLPHLSRLLAKCPYPEFEVLRKLVINLIKKWEVGEIITLDQDMDFQFVQSKWPKDKSFNNLFDKINISNLQHYDLLYTYRNSLVHELRSPTHDLDRDYSELPFYSILGKFISETYVEEVWILNYPVKFYIRILNQSIKNLEKYLIENRLDPYNYSTFGDYWIEELNI